MKLDDVNNNVNLEDLTKEELYKALCICVMDLNKIWASILRRCDFTPFYASDFIDYVVSE